MQGRIAAFYETRDGYVQNLDGGTLQGKDTRAVRGSLHFNAGERGGFDLILNYQKDTPPGTAFRSQVIPNTRGSLDPVSYTHLDVYKRQTKAFPAPAEPTSPIATP